MTQYYLVDWIMVVLTITYGNTLKFKTKRDWQSGIGFSIVHVLLGFMIGSIAFIGSGIAHGWYCHHCRRYKF